MPFVLLNSCLSSSSLLSPSISPNPFLLPSFPFQQNQKRRTKKNAHSTFSFWGDVGGRGSGRKGDREVVTEYDSSFGACRGEGEERGCFWGGICGNIEKVCLLLQILKFKWIFTHTHLPIYTSTHLHRFAEKFLESGFSKLMASIKVSFFFLLMNCCHYTFLLHSNLPHKHNHRRTSKEMIEKLFLEIKVIITFSLLFLSPSLLFSPTHSPFLPFSVVYLSLSKFFLEFYMHLFSSSPSPSPSPSSPFSDFSLVKSCLTETDIEVSLSLPFSPLFSHPFLHSFSLFSSLFPSSSVYFQCACSLSN